MPVICRGLLCISEPKAKNHDSSISSSCSHVRQTYLLKALAHAKGKTVLTAVIFSYANEGENKFFYKHGKTIL